nr:tonsoku-like protein [Macaca nemestrina]
MDSSVHTGRLRFGFSSPSLQWKQPSPAVSLSARVSWGLYHLLQERGLAQTESCVAGARMTVNAPVRPDHTRPEGSTGPSPGSLQFPGGSDGRRSAAEVRPRALPHRRLPRPARASRAAADARTSPARIPEAAPCSRGRRGQGARRGRGRGARWLSRA